MNPLLKNFKTIINMTSRLITSENNVLAVQDFARESSKVLNADFCFVWGKFNHGDEYKLIYQTPYLSFRPEIPVPKKEKRNLMLNLGSRLMFDGDVKQINYQNEISSQLKSYIIIPISYGDHSYGNIILGYKKKHKFMQDELVIAEAMGNKIAHLVTINWLIENERRVLKMVEKQKEMEVLLENEKSKNEFVSNATHEIRTPLAVIKGNIDLILRGNLRNQRELKSGLRSINYEVNHLSRILSDLVLITSKNENSNRRESLEKVDLSKVIKRAVKRCKILAKTKKNFHKIKIHTSNLNLGR